MAWVFDTAGEYNIGLRVWDNGVLNFPDFASLPSEPGFTTVRVIDNAPPVADAGGPYEVVECQPLTLDGAASTDPNGDPLIFSWDIDGDGFEDSTVPAPVHTWDADGDYTVSLIVSDSILESAESVATVTVLDTAPTATLSGSQSLQVDEAGAFSAFVPTGCDAIAAIEWDWDFVAMFNPSGDEGTAQSHTYDVQGDYVVAVRVTDADSSSVIVTLAIEVLPSESALRPSEPGQILVRYSRRGYNSRIGMHMARVYVMNVSESTISGPIVLVYDEFDPPTAALANPDGEMPDGREYIDITPYLPNGELLPGQMAGGLVVMWTNPGGQHLDFVTIPYLLNAAPRITSQPQTSASEGAMYSYLVTAEDDDGDPVEFSLAEGPAGMTINPSTGLLAWRPDQDAGGDHNVTIVASDGYETGFALQSYVLTVFAVNVPPQIISTPDTTITVGQPYNYDVDAIDGDGDPIAYALEVAPAGMTIDVDGLIEFTPADVGGYDVTVTASDGHGHLAIQSFRRKRPQQP